MSSVGRQNTIGKCDSVSTSQKNTVLTQLCIDLGNVKSLLAYHREKIQWGEARGLQIRATQSTTKEKKDLEKRKQLPKCWPGSSYKQGTQKSAGLQGAEIEKKNTFVLLKKSLLVSIDEEKGNSGGTPRS